MATYLERIKASNPDAYEKIAKLGKYSADEVFGGKLQDYQAQLFTPLSADVLAQANDIKDLTPVETSYDDGVSSGSSVTGYKKNLGTVNGIPLTATYDENKKLTGYEGDSATRTWLNGKQSVSGNWDASGKPTPTQYTSKKGGVLGNIVGDIAGSFGGYLPALANLVVPGSGLIISGANAALNGGDIGGFLKNAAISQIIGNSGLGDSVAAATGSNALGQFANSTGAGLLSGNDLDESLRNAAINVGSNTAARGLLNSTLDTKPNTTDTTKFTPTSTDLTPTDFSIGTPGSGGIGLKADLAPITDNTDKYSLTPTNTGGIGFDANLLPLNNTNKFSLNTNVGNLDSMGGGTGIKIPEGEKPTLGSIGTVTKDNQANPAATGAVASVIKSLFNKPTGNPTTGTGNMATTNTQTTDALTSLFGGLLGGSGDLMRGASDVAARKTAATDLITAGSKAATASQFRPVGTTTTFGKSNFSIDPTTGQLISAGYDLSPEARAYQDSLMRGNTAALTDAERLRTLGRGYISQDPNAVAADYYNKQQALLAPSRDVESARLANQLQQTGRTGVAVAQGGNLGAANPELQALLNARAMTDANLAANAQTYGQNQVKFGQGLLNTALDPFNAGIKTSAELEKLGQQPVGMSTDIAKLFQGANETGAKYNLDASKEAARTLFPANQYNPFADVLSGAAKNTQLTGALGGLLSKGIGGLTNVLGSAGANALTKYLGSLGSGVDLNQAASDWITENQDIIPKSTITGTGDVSWIDDFLNGGGDTMGMGMNEFVGNDDFQYGSGG